MGYIIALYLTKLGKKLKKNISDIIQMILLKHIGYG